MSALTFFLLTLGRQIEEAGFRVDWTGNTPSLWLQDEDLADIRKVRRWLTRRDVEMISNGYTLHRRLKYVGPR